jgi:NAD(P)-dependent dehydrogenase (short-subunit alcohol dehydrogenase family)
MTGSRTERVAIVVGAAGELGRATAVKLADIGMTVVAVDRDEPGLAALPGDIARELADATDPDAVGPMVERGRPSGR